MPTTYVFGKGGHTNVRKSHIKKAIAWFASDEYNTGQFPSLTINQRNVLVLALQRLELARAELTKARK
jgi:hypothetical protein